MAFNSKHEWLKNPFFGIFIQPYTIIFSSCHQLRPWVCHSPFCSYKRDISLVNACVFNTTIVSCVSSRESLTVIVHWVWLSHHWGKKSPCCSLDSIIYAHSGHHSLHCLTSYSWPIDGETLCASWWSLQRSLQRPYFHFKSPSHQYTDQKKRKWGKKEAGFLTLRHVSHFTVRHDLLYDFMKQRTILEQTTNHCLETKCLLKKSTFY